MKIGIASSDGIVVNQHFGRCSQLYIYEVTEEEDILLLEKKQVLPICNRGDHDEHTLSQRVAEFQYLDVMIASKIGQRAGSALEQAGVRIYELPMLIEDAIKKVIAYETIFRMIHLAVK